jgi:hypothetical protein
VAHQVRVFDVVQQHVGVASTRVYTVQIREDVL